jgi:hypothetical protein
MGAKPSYWSQPRRTFDATRAASHVADRVPEDHDVVGPEDDRFPEMSRSMRHNGPP